MTIPYTFRKAHWDEKASIFGLYCLVMKPYVEKIWGWEQQWQKNDFTAHFEPENITVVSVAGKLVGYAHVERRCDKLFLRMLLLVPEYQSKGIGTHLLESVVESASRQALKVELQVFRVNEAAKKFYDHHGFQVVSKTPDSLVMVFEA